MKIAITAKFSIPAMRNALLATEGLIVEATRNPVFGIGLPFTAANLADRSTWSGGNAMGQLLTDFRDSLLHHSPNQSNLCATNSDLSNQPMDLQTSSCNTTQANQSLQVTQNASSPSLQPVPSSVLPRTPVPDNVRHSSTSDIAQSGLLSAKSPHPNTQVYPSQMQYATPPSLPYSSIASTRHQVPPSQHHLASPSMTPLHSQPSSTYFQQGTMLLYQQTPLYPAPIPLSTSRIETSAPLHTQDGTLQPHAPPHNVEPIGSTATDPV